ncbi:MAG TPA: RNA polymerase sigma factor [Deinococcales bacterium]|nr:RNA polymerase sigma factor [Deinococcales bacterium]
MDSPTLEALKRGDQPAWEAVIVTHQDRILNYLYHLEGNYEDALDLTQEAFFRAWRGIKTFREGEDFLPWLYTIARNTQIEKHRRKHHASFSIEEAQEDVGYEPTAPQKGPQARAEERQEQERVREALLTLPEEYRSAVVLRFMEDRPYEEIASIQGVAVGTAKSRVFRGKEMLARALEGRVAAG